MTEAEWLACTDTKQMLVSLRGQGSDRKFRLFALACLARIARYITDPHSRAAIAFAERFAEVGLKGRRGRPQVSAAADQVCAEASARARLLTGEDHRTAMLAVNANHAARNALDTLAYHSALFCSGFAANAVGWDSGPARAQGFPATYTAAQQEEMAAQRELIRDVFGLPPFRPAGLPDEVLTWNRGTVPRLAQGIHAGAFDQVPVLGDALEEAGYADEAALAHCRGGGVHIRGCWVVDLVLGKPWGKDPLPG